LGCWSAAARTDVTAASNSAIIGVDRTSFISVFYLEIVSQR
jgi:hypothetical protein